MRASLLVIILVSVMPAIAQEKSVRPGINDPFQDPDVKKYEATFEGESREVFAKRKEIVKAIGLKPGDVIADIGAGTGLYTRLFAAEVGDKGTVYAVDIAQKFLDHIKKVNVDAKITNVKTVLCKADSTGLSANSIDVAFICDTYHHFEFPFRTMASLHSALKPGGRVVLIDFQRIKGQSRDWVMTHVRDGQEVFEKEIIDSGFKKTKAVKDILIENYCVIFEKVEPTTKFIHPIIEGYGGVVLLPSAVEPPTKGTKVIFEATSVAKEVGKPFPVFERAAVFLNLAGAAGLKAKDIEIVIVLHGDATLAALDEKAYLAKTGRTNENSTIMERLAKAGVQIQVCGQSLQRKDLEIKSISHNVKVAASALTSVINHQQRGFVCIQ